MRDNGHKYSIFDVNQRVYELHDHLGNVRVLTQDQVWYDGMYNNVYTAGFYTYYAFGSLMPSPYWDRLSDNGYKFGFNGQERDDYISGSGNSKAFKFREQDTRIGRFMSVDPLASKYPYWSPYAFAGNRPIDGIDLEGKEWSSATEGNNTKFTAKVVVVNRSNVIDQNQFEKIVAGIQQSFNKTYSKTTADGHSYRAEFKSEVYNKEHPQTFYMFLRDQTADFSKNDETNTIGGETPMFKGASQNNHINVYVSVNGQIRDMQSITHDANHELGHSAGLFHPWDKENNIEDIKQPNFFSEISTGDRQKYKLNLMNSIVNPIRQLQSTEGSNITSGQFNRIKSTVEKEQPASMEPNQTK